MNAKGHTCVSEKMAREAFMRAAEVWTKDMDQLANKSRYDFIIVDNEKKIVDSLHGCDDLDSP